ncbi:MAG: MoaD/ThiS family protein [Acidimicrobiia bacterium]
MKLRIPTPLRSYTGQEPSVEAQGGTIDEVLVDVDRRFPGLRFRVVDEQGRLRRHMRVFVNDSIVRDLHTVVGPDDEITLMQALSGG